MILNKYFPSQQYKQEFCISQHDLAMFTNTLSVLLISLPAFSPPNAEYFLSISPFDQLYELSKYHKYSDKFDIN